MAEKAPSRKAPEVDEVLHDPYQVPEVEGVLHDPYQAWREESATQPWTERH